MREIKAELSEKQTQKTARRRSLFDCAVWLGEERALRVDTCAQPWLELAKTGAAKSRKVTYIGSSFESDSESELDAARSGGS